MATTRYIVDNVSGQTINGQQFVPNYRVYTALLTQSGVDDPQSIYEGELTIGVTYFINGSAILDGCDFTNVGAPNNEPGTYFVATGTTPNWGNTVNPDMLTYNNGSPVVTVLENTIGNIWWTYLIPGQYQAESDALFTEGKTICTTSGIIDVTSDPWKGYSSVVVSANYVGIRTGEVSQGTSDDLLLNTLIEIRVYN